MKNAAMNMAKYFSFTVRYFAGYCCYADYYYFYRKNKNALPAAI